MNPAVVPTAAEFIDHYQIVRKLRVQHGQQVAIGLFISLAVIGYNVVTPRADPWFSPLIGGIFAVVFLVSGGIWMVISVRRAQRQRRQTLPSARAQATMLSQTSGQAGRSLLSWTTVGQALVGFGTLARLRFGDFPGDVLLWAGLLPTALLLIYSIVAIPTRERVLRVS